MAEAAIVAAKAAAAWLAKEGVKQAIVKIAIQLAVSAVVAKITSQQNQPRPQGTLIDLDLASDAPRRLQVGRRGNGGVLADWFTEGSKNERLYQIIYLGEGPMGPLRSVSSGGREIWSGTLFSGNRVKLSELGDSYVTYYDGSPGQTANALLVSKGIGYASTSVGTGCAYVILELKFDQDSVPYPPDVFFETDGAKFYDRRYDSTAGGNGPQRLYDPSTWVLSKNPAVVLDHYKLGRYFTALDARPSYGIGLRSTEVPFERFQAQANTCDELVVTNGGSQVRYEANGFLFSDRSHKDIILDLCRAMNAKPADFGGRVSIISGEAKAPVMTLEEGDIIEGTKEHYSPKRSWGELVGGVRGTYQDSANNFQPVDYPQILNEDWRTQDGGETKVVTLNLEMETDVERAQRLATLFALKERRQALLSGVYTLKAIELEEGDWFVRTGGKFGAGKTFEVIGSPSLNPETLAVSIQAFEVDSTDSAWNSTDAIVPSDPVSDPTAAIARVQPPALTLSPVIDISASGVKVPVVIFTNTEHDQELPPSVEIEVFPNDGQGAPTGSGFVYLMPAGEETLKSSPLLPGEGYVARWRGTQGERVSDWSGWTAFTSATEFVAGSVVGQGPGATAVDLAAFDAIAANQLATATANVASLQGTVATLTSSLSSTTSSVALLSQQLTDEVAARVAAVQEVADDLVQEVADRTAGDALNAAAIVAEQTAREDGDSANAASLTALTTRVDDAEATIATNETASADRDNALTTRLDILDASFTVAGNERIANSIGELHPVYRWTFENTSSGWGNVRSTLTPTADGLEFVNNSDSEWGYMVENLPNVDLTDYPLLIVHAALGPDSDAWDLAVRWSDLSGDVGQGAPAFPVGVAHDGEFTVFVFDLRQAGNGYDAATQLERIFLHAEPRDTIGAAFKVKEVVFAKEGSAGLAIETNARIITEQQARADGDSANATEISALTARVGTNEADILAEQTARSDGDTANATLISGLSARVDTAESDIDTNEADIVAEQTARADGDSANAASLTALGARVDDAEADIVTNAGAIATESGARATETSALSARLDTAEADIDAAEGDITSNQASIATNATAIADETSARVAAVAGLQASVDQNEALSVIAGLTVLKDGSPSILEGELINASYGVVRGSVTPVTGGLTFLNDPPTDWGYFRVFLDSGYRDVRGFTHVLITVTPNTSAGDWDLEVRYQNSGSGAGQPVANPIHPLGYMADGERRTYVFDLSNQDSGGVLFPDCDNVASFLVYGRPTQGDYGFTVHNFAIAKADPGSAPLTNEARILQAEETAATENQATATSLTALTATVAALDTQVDGVAADVATNTADILTNAGAIADETSARAAALSSLTATVSTVQSDLDAAEANISSAQAEVDAAEANLATLQTSQTATQADLDAAEADLATAIADLDTAEATLATLQNDVSTNTANITSNATAIADETSARASAITTLQATVDGNTASVTTNAAAIADVDGKLEAVYGIAVDGNTGQASIILLSDGSELGSAIVLTADTIELNGDVIVNGTITTDAIAVGAVTTREVSQNNGAQALTDGVWFTAASFNFLSVGIGVELRGSGIMKNGGFRPGGAGIMEYRLKRGGTVLLTGTAPRTTETEDYGNNIYFDTTSGFFGFDFNDLPTTGTHAYSLEVRITGSNFASGESLSVDNSFLSAREFKR